MDIPDAIHCPVGSTARHLTTPVWPLYTYSYTRYISSLHFVANILLVMVSYFSNKNHHNLLPLRWIPLKEMAVNPLVLEV